MSRATRTGRWLKAMAWIWEDWRRRQAARQALLEITERSNDHLLRDAGISRDEARDILRNRYCPAMAASQADTPPIL